MFLWYVKLSVWWNRHTSPAYAIAPWRHWPRFACTQIIIFKYSLLNGLLRKMLCAVLCSPAPFYNVFCKLCYFSTMLSHFTEAKVKNSVNLLWRHSRAAAKISWLQPTLLAVVSISKTYLWFSTTTWQRLLKVVNVFLFSYFLLCEVAMTCLLFYLFIIIII